MFRIHYIKKSKLDLREESVDFTLMSLKQVETLNLRNAYHRFFIDKYESGMVA